MRLLKISHSQSYDLMLRDKKVVSVLAFGAPNCARGRVRVTIENWHALCHTPPVKPGFDL